MTYRASTSPREQPSSALPRVELTPAVPHVSGAAAGVARDVRDHADPLTAHRTRRNR